MKLSYCICLCWCFLIVKATLAQESISDLNTQRADVILIRATQNNGKTETSAGFYAGHDEENAYFVTALHAVRDQTTGQKSSDVEVQFWGSGTSHHAVIFDQFNELEDLAVLIMPTKEVGANMVPMEQKDPTAELNIHLIGHPQETPGSLG